MKAATPVRAHVLQQVDMQGTWTTRQLARWLQVSARTIQRMRAEGYIRGYRVRRAGLRFVISEVLEDIARHESELPARRISGQLIYSDDAKRRNSGHIKTALVTRVVDENGRIV